MKQAADHEMIQGGQQESAKPTTLLAERAQSIPLDKAREELLREVPPPARAPMRGNERGCG